MSEVTFVDPCDARDVIHVVVEMAHLTTTTEGFLGTASAANKENGLLAGLGVADQHRPPAVVARAASVVPNVLARVGRRPFALLAGVAGDVHSGRKIQELESCLEQQKGHDYRSHCLFLHCCSLSWGSTCYKL
ncbi:hypothetical protein R1flu_027121 [Riccia fluitans]|uniref:Uncharacterized protein n=1 Tax=Riccia fluitans TaxID=41844 RepID=A0ABD1XM00_9MARC